MLNALWNPTGVGEIALPHRLAMAPMTRSRHARAACPPS